MQSTQRTVRDVAVHWASGPVLDPASAPVGAGFSGMGFGGGGFDRAPGGELRSYLRELALGRR